jgi:hypothetical protein
MGGGMHPFAPTGSGLGAGIGDARAALVAPRAGALTSPNSGAVRYPATGARLSLPRATCSALQRSSLREPP